MIGRTISHYKITEKLGEGGMGVVYKAEDTKLDRPVALKFLAAHLVSDQEVRKRFEREAKAAAALNHPNICTVYEIDEVEGKTFISMAFIEGEALDKTIEGGPLKLANVLDIAIQAARGLQAAHEKKIVHRDIKPANLMVTGSGPKQHITIMDFGLAQLADRSKLTRTDETMGTVTYMSPEQTYGADIDHRSDIWSLGVVIYEMVTGQPPFKGHYDKAVMYSITSEEPEPMTALRTGVPMELELLVNKCLAKGADRRFQSAAELLVDLETLNEKLKSGKSAVVQAGPVATGAHAGPRQGQAESSSLLDAPENPLVKYRVIENLEEQDDSVTYRAEDTQTSRSVAIRIIPESAAATQQRRQALRRMGTLAAVAITALLLGVLLTSTFRGPSPPPAQATPVTRFTLPTEGPVSSPTVSPDGRHVAYWSGLLPRQSLWVQDLGQDEPRALVESEHGIVDSNNTPPFWSPDSKFIAFFTREGLKKISLSGGQPSTVCELPPNPWYSGTWSPDGSSIIFSRESAVFEVPAQGGEPRLLFESQDALLASSPSLLPTLDGRRHMLFVKQQSIVLGEIVKRDLETGEEETLARGMRPVYARSGDILYNVAEPPGVWAMPFSLETLQATAAPFLVRGDVINPSVGRDGTLVYQEATGAGAGQLVWLNRDGRRVGEIGQIQGNIRHPTLSPGGTQVAVEGTEGGNSDIWIHETARPLKSRVTFGPAVEVFPRWMPSGEDIVFTSVQGEDIDILRRSVDGSGEPRELVATELPEYPSDWTRDGAFFVYVVGNPKTGLDIWYLKRNGEGEEFESQALLETPFSESLPRFSPDGRYVSYMSNESGRYEIYVRTFPQGGGRYQVSVNGAEQARWSRDGKELYFVQGDQLMAAAVSTSETGFATEPPRLLFRHPALNVSSSTTFDVAADGRFVVVEPVESEDDRPPRIHVVQNWLAEFEDRQSEPLP
jgi:Tol biopolymer transport system component/predicted Ser/Thr protein kinase